MGNRMLAVTDSSDLQLIEQPIPEPADGEVVIKVDFAGINRADLSQLKGTYPPPPGASNILGLEVSGHRVDTGERVMALLSSSGYAQYVAVPEGQIMTVPESVDQAQAAAVPESLATAWSNLVDVLKVDVDETVLIQGGSGSLGTFAVQLTRELGANVIATAGGLERCQQVESLGATAIDHRLDGLSDRVKELAPEGVNAILDIVGSDVGDMVPLLQRGGRIAIIALQGATTATVPVGLLMVKRLSIFGTTLRSRPSEEKAAIISASSDFAMERLADGRITPIVDSVFPISKVAEAIEHVEHGSPFGKVVLDLRELN
ncbi:MAG: NAD(P)H-quinone oxidoreductase [Flaviflexus sp.]|uniref:NAD(P)H-quinone oxidoreductase n=1 Tax=Flaviflexus sp. TaxID=1969482 RepID=UPI00352E4ED9